MGVEAGQGRRRVRHPRGPRADLPARRPRPASRREPRSTVTEGRSYPRGQTIRSRYRRDAWTRGDGSTQASCGHCGQLAQAGAAWSAAGVSTQRATAERPRWPVAGDRAHDVVGRSERAAAPPASGSRAAPAGACPRGWVSSRRAAAVPARSCEQARPGAGRRPTRSRSRRSRRCCRRPSVEARSRGRGRRRTGWRRRPATEPSGSSRVMTWAPALAEPLADGRDRAPEARRARRPRCAGRPGCGLARRSCSCSRTAATAVSPVRSADPATGPGGSRSRRCRRGGRPALRWKSVEGDRGQRAEDAVDPAGVEAEPPEAGLELGDVVAPQHRACGR